jgi:hypothetical protein
MKRASAMILLSAVLVAGAMPVRADTTPVIRGNVTGLELCPQSLCGAAVFVGLFHGQVGFVRNALGLMAVAVHHQALPETAGGCAAITDGLWELRVGLRRFAGLAAGQLCYNGDNTYDVSVVLSLGGGTMTFTGVLDHNVFPPTIIGAIDQTP